MTKLVTAIELVDMMGNYCRIGGYYSNKGLIQGRGSKKECLIQ